MSAQPHVASYYAANTTLPPQRAPLVGEETADVCVVGAGFTGLSTALELAERGYRVVVLEANRIGWGASGRNGGQVGSGFPAGMERLRRWVGAEDARALFDLAEEAKAIVRQRVVRHGIDCALKWGTFQAAGKPRHLEEARATRALWSEAFGYEGLRLAETPEDARRYVDSPRYIGGLFDPGAGHLHPLDYCLGLARAAQAAGAAIHEASPVTALDGTGDRAVTLTDRGRVEADTVVLCGNAYLGDLVPEIRRYYVPVGSYIVATRPLGVELAAQVIPADCAVYDSNHILNYYRLSADRRLLFGGRVETSPLKEPDPRRFLGARIRRLFPRIAEVELEYAWGGRLAFTGARMPQVGRLGARVLFAQGYSGEGVAMSGLVGRVLAEAVAGRMERFDLFDRLPHRPFPGGRLLQRPALALGFLWYRLLDAMP